MNPASNSFCDDAGLNFLELAESKLEGTSMNRRDLLAASAGLTLTGFPFLHAFSLQTSEERNHALDRESNRHPVLVRSGFTRKPNGTDERAPSPSGMFDTEVVRASDSQGRLAIFVFPPGDHHPYRGRAPSRASRTG